MEQFKNKVIQGDCLEKLKELEDNSVDSIVTDPPYHLVSIVKRFGKENSAPAKFGTDGAFSRASKGFMGKDWDGVNEDGIGIAQKVELWKECLRVLKPGGHLLAFSGTRTYHRMASAIEDAGFEVRDMIEWVYGSGFPKSLNIGKAVDKLQGNEREVVGQKDINAIKALQKFKEQDGRTVKTDFSNIEMNYTKGTSEWEGWGTALKPAHESIMLAQKPLTSVPLFDKIDIDLIIKKILCLLVSNVKIAESNSVLSQRGLSEELNIAQWIAEENTNTQDALSVLTDMLLLESKINTNLNIVILWLNILEDIYQLKNKFTTLTEISLTIELKILESLEWENIFQNITQAKDKTTDGKNVNVLTAVNLFNAVRLKLNHILTHFAQDPAILKDEYSDIRPNHEPICMARKPLSEKTVAENCLKWGTGGINIDESRVEAQGQDLDKLNSEWDREWNTNYTDYAEKVGGNAGFNMDKAKKENACLTGRFPANLIHDGSEEVRECFPNESERFFKSIIYQAKASKSERNMGCEELEEKPKVFNGQSDKPSTDMKDVEKRFTTLPKANNHPTVKPIALMEYLINMVTREGQTVLDMFMGSGTTGVACKNLNRNFIGIEKEEEYFKIANARIYQEETNK